MDICLSRSSVRATEAYELGLLTDIVPENELQNYEEIVRIIIARINGYTKNSRR